MQRFMLQSVITHNKFLFTFLRGFVLQLARGRRTGGVGRASGTVIEAWCREEWVGEVGQL